MAAVTICSDFGAQKNKVSHCFQCFPIYLPWSDGTRCHDLTFLNVELSTNFRVEKRMLHKMKGVLKGWAGEGRARWEFSWWCYLWWWCYRRSGGEELCLWIRQMWFKSQILGKTLHISEPWFLQIQMWNNNSIHFIRKTFKEETHSQLILLL